MHRRALLGLTGGAALGVLVPRPVLGAELTREEEWRLAAFSPVRVPLDLDLPQGSYFGGIVYQKVRLTVDEVMTVAGDPGSYTSILSHTLEARVLSRRDRDVQVYLRQGEGAISVGYVTLVRREASNLIRFWLDPSQPHDLDDASGFLRVEPWSKPPWLQSKEAPGPRSVITWGLLLRIDSTALKLRFSEGIRRYAMETPNLIAKALYAKDIGRR
jgi:hypothetical protein